MVDLDSDPTKLLEVVEVGKQLLMTRGTLTTFSIANDVAKYFAILPRFSWSVPGAQAARRDAARLPVQRDPLRGHLQRPHHHPAHSRWRCAASDTGRSGAAADAAAVAARLREWAAVIAPFVGIKAIDLALAAFGIV